MDRGGLILSRKQGEWLLIGDQIRVQVYQIRGDKVRLRIEAPDEVPVDRMEVRARKESDERSE